MQKEYRPQKVFVVVFYFFFFSNHCNFKPFLGLGWFFFCPVSWIVIMVCQHCQVTSVVKCSYVTNTHQYIDNRCNYSKTLNLVIESYGGFYHSLLDFG